MPVSFKPLKQRKTFLRTCHTVSFLFNCERTRHPFRGYQSDQSEYNHCTAWHAYEFFEIADFQSPIGRLVIFSIVSEVATSIVQIVWIPSYLCDLNEIQ